jgi:tRNA1Val (adenine37-N6)-methyltransferase
MMVRSNARVALEAFCVTMAGMRTDGSDRIVGHDDLVEVVDTGHEKKKHRLISPPAMEETLDRLVGTWEVFQLKRGHRGSTDDRLVAERAVAHRPGVERVLELGSGVGTVGLTALWHLRRAQLVAVEAQEISVALYRKTLAHNGLSERVESIQSDFRDLGDLGRFPLILGSPPYIPLGKGRISPHPQRAACRIEMRGSVFDYCTTAARFLAHDGVFVYVMAAVDPRTEEAPVAAGLYVHERLDVRFRADQPPLIAVVVCGRERVPRQSTTLTVRGADGEWTDEYLDRMSAIRARPRQ